MEYQECKKCYAKFEWTIEYFNWEDKRKGTLKKICKTCFHKIAKGYREKYKIQAQDNVVNLVMPTSYEIERLMYKAYKVIYANAFDKLLTKAEYEKLKITK